MDLGPDLARLAEEVEALGDLASHPDRHDFLTRLVALDRLEFGLAEALDAARRLGPDAERVVALRERAEAARGLMGAWEAEGFRRLREELRRAEDKGGLFRMRLREALGAELPEGDVGEGRYDAWDAWANGLFLHEELPEESGARGAEGVFYQKSPARLAFEVSRRARMSAGDVFFDVGSGLGQFVLLVHLLTGVRGVGLEVEAAFTGYARQRAAELGLAGVEFRDGDAREADFRKGTVFYLYTPFEGGTLRAVLERLRSEAERRPIRIFALGPCGEVLAGQPWLEVLEPEAGGEARAGLRVFRSRRGKGAGIWE